MNLVAMSYFGSTVYDVGQTSGSPAIGTPVRSPDPTQDYIYAGPGRITPQIPQLLPSEFDDVTRAFGHRTYEAMLTDPAVQSSYLGLKLAILNGPLQVLPAVRPKRYRYRPPDVRGRSGTGDPLAGDEALAQEVAEFCERQIQRLKVPFKATLLQILDAMAYGNKLAEKTWEVAEGGPDGGRLCLKSLNVKPHWAWQFVVDGFMTPVGIMTYVPPDSIGGPAGFAAGGLAIVPIEKFALFTWLPRDNDPRGASALRAAYDWWNLKVQVKPFYYAHLRRFGSPSLDGELSEKDTASSRPVDPITGRELPGAPVDPGRRFMTQLLAFQNNAVIVRPAGSKLNVIEPRSNGEAFLAAFDMFDRQICLAIGLQTRATLEARNGSRADSDTAENTRGLVVAHGREALGGWASRQVFHDCVRLNYGQDVADRLTPTLVVGQTEAQDRPKEWGAAASIGYTIGESQLEEMDCLLGLPDRDMEADRKAARDRARRQREAMGGPGGPADEADQPGQPDEGDPEP